MAKHCIRDGDACYAIKKLRNEVRNDKSTYRNGLVDFAIEARFLAIIQNPHIIKMRALPSEGFFQEESYITMDRLYDTLEVRMRNWKVQENCFTSIVGCCRGGTEKYMTLMGEKVLIALDLANAMYTCMT